MPKLLIAACSDAMYARLLFCLLLHTRLLASLPAPIRDIPVCQDMVELIKYVAGIKLTVS